MVSGISERPRIYRHTELSILLSLCADHKNSTRPMNSSSPVVVHTEPGEQQVAGQARYQKPW